MQQCVLPPPLRPLPTPSCPAASEGCLKPPPTRPPSPPRHSTAAAAPPPQKTGPSTGTVVATAAVVGAVTAAAVTAPRRRIDRRRRWGCLPACSCSCGFFCAVCGLCGEVSRWVRWRGAWDPGVESAGPGWCGGRWLWAAPCTSGACLPAALEVEVHPRRGCDSSVGSMLPGLQGRPLLTPWSSSDPLVGPEPAGHHRAHVRGGCVGWLRPAV